MNNPTAFETTETESRSYWDKMIYGKKYAFKVHCETIEGIAYFWATAYRVMSSLPPLYRIIDVDEVSAIIRPVLAGEVVPEEWVENARWELTPEQALCRERPVCRRSSEP
jgi:hypothetical protein